jgi:hypothetical protein
MTDKPDISAEALDLATNALSEAHGIIHLAMTYAEAHTDKMGTAPVAALSGASSLISDARDRLIH